MAERNFLVVGLGTFGAQTAINLARGGAHVLAVDNNERAVEALKDQVTVAVCCDATDAVAMKQIGAFDMEFAIVALRHHFDVTVLATHMLRKNGFERILVQVDTEKEEEAIRAVGATDVIFPERDMAQRIANNLIFPDLADQVPLGEDFSLIELKCPPEFDGQTLIDLELRKQFGISVIATKIPPERPGKREKVSVAPRPDQPLQEGENLLVVGTRKQLVRFKEKFNLNLPPD